MIRKKLPAYGAALLKALRAGERPRCIHLVFGNDWRARLTCARPWLPGHPLIAVKPEDYAAGVYDFALVTGAHVCVFDHDMRDTSGFHDAGPPVPWHCRPVYVLIGELAAHAAKVELQPVVVGRAGAAVNIDKPQPADELALIAKLELRRWPHWWSDEIEMKNGQRQTRWWNAVAEERFEQVESA